MSTTDRAIIVIPPLVKYTAGPQLGPALLAGATEGGVRVLDLNIRYMRRHLPPGEERTPTVLGDHEKPSDALRVVQRKFEGDLACHLPPTRWRRNSALTATFEHEELLVAAAGLIDDPEVGGFIEEHIPVERPLFVGLSLMYSGQVLWAISAALIARRRWPGVPVFFGGAHVTAMRDQIATDPRYGAYADGFVAGQAEATVRELVRSLRLGQAWPAGVFRAGEGFTPAVSDPKVIPRFTDLDLYGAPRVTLPARTSRGCAYGRCSFCTYPAIEGHYEELPLAPVEATVQLAQPLGAVVSFKDSLILPHRLQSLAQAVGGRVPWSACTKLHPALDEILLRELVEGGCRTLEIGLETLVPSSQALIGKPQSPELFIAFLDAARQVGLSLVVNVITGFPGEDRDEAERWLEWIRQAISQRPGLDVHLEHNTFELERRSIFGRTPENFGLRVVAQWPWASVVAWEEVDAAEAQKAA